jgi:hypothetical protein
MIKNKIKDKKKKKKATKINIGLLYIFYLWKSMI